MHFDIPGKTFLVGEYLAMKTGQALVVTTAPGFSVDIEILKANQEFGAKDSSISKFESGSDNQFLHLLSSPQSPAALLFKSEPEFILQKFDFKNHLGLGGFGASTAEFLAVYWAIQTLKSRIKENGGPGGSAEIIFKKLQNICNIISFRKNHSLTNSTQDLLTSYWDWAWAKKGQRPSGLDLLAQAAGGVCSFADWTLKTSQPWPFKELDFLLVPTGQKLATHEHLQSAQDFSTTALAAIFLRAEQAFLVKDERGFLQAVADYSAQLEKQKWITPFSANLLTQIRSSAGQQAGIRGSKACGAMGADVLLLLIDKSKKSQVKDFLKILGLKAVACAADVWPTVKN
ncbi:MAG: hypothetical protein ACOYOK_05440 [Pseudobdellovibrionaceae bacterium]